MRLCNKILNKIIGDKEIVEDKYSSGVVDDFIKLNKEKLTTDKYAIANMKITGPSRDTKFFNVSLGQLQALSKILKIVK